MPELRLIRKTPPDAGKLLLPILAIARPGALPHGYFRFGSRGSVAPPASRQAP